MPLSPFSSICLALKKDPVCGDKILDEGEDCDCGNSSECLAMDPNCVPPGGFRNQTPCSFLRKEGCECSVRDVCCSGNCSFIPAELKRKCSPWDDGCGKTYHCDGTAAKCPSAHEHGDVFEDGLFCKGTSQTCSKGYCNSTVCLDNKLVDCWCEPFHKFECYVCCLDPGGHCLPAVFLGTLTKQNSTAFRENGTVCSRGRCNESGICRKH